MPDTDQSIVIKVLNGAFVSETHILEAVGDIEVTDSIELTTEPGVMGRIGPRFPRSASFSVRLRNADPRTPNHQTARAQHSLLRGLFGKLFYVDARASPPETITWTLENLKAMDQNDAKNAYGIEVTVREILGGQFGEFIDPNELSMEKGLVPTSTPTPAVLGIGNQEATLSFGQIPLPGPDSIFFDQVTGDDLYARETTRGVPGTRIVPLKSALAAIANASSGNAAEFILDKAGRNSFVRNTNRLIAYAAPLPEVSPCSLITLKFRLLGTDFTIKIDATTRFTGMTVTYGTVTLKPTPRPLTRQMAPGTLYILKRAGKEPLASNSISRRPGVGYPVDMDLMLAFVPSEKNLEFSVANFPRFHVLAFFIGGLVP